LVISTKAQVLVTLLAEFLVERGILAEVVNLLKDTSCGFSISIFILLSLL